MESKYLVAVYSFLPFGPARTGLLLKYFKSAEKVWRVAEKKLLEVGLNKDTVSKFVKYRNDFDIVSYFKKLKDKGIGVVTIKDNNYPKNLIDLDDAPPVLYYLVM